MNKFPNYIRLGHWKYPFASMAIFLVIQSCHLKPGLNNIQTTLLAQCDELDIVFYGEDSFVFKDFDTSTIKHYIELISFENDASLPDCEVTESLIFKQKGHQLFKAEISINRNVDSRCNLIMYQLESKAYKHLLTYQTGMGIDQIYEHRINPQGNPWTGVDSSKFRFEDLKTGSQQ